MEADTPGSHQGQGGAVLADAALPSLPVRMFEVIVSPGKVFLALQQRPVWFWVLALTAVGAALTVWFIPEEAWNNMFREQMLASGRVTEGELPEMGTPALVGATIAAMVSVFLISVVIAALTFGVFVFLFGDQGGYKQHLSIVAHAGVVTLIGALVALPLRISQLDPQLTLSVGTLFPFLPDGYFYNVLQSLDLFALWAAVLTALGVSMLDARRSWGSAASVTVGLAVVFALAVGFIR
ncbi:MAG: YIP1 family protein [Longimicrobiales bacterium]